MPKLVVALLLVCLVSLPVAAVADGTGTFASYVDGSSGSVDGVNFTLSGLSSPSFGDPIQSLGMSGADWNNAGTQSGRIYNQNTVSSFSITFDAPITDLALYLYYIRGTGPGGGGYSSYTFSEPFIVTAGLTGINSTGTTLDTSTTSFANGVLSFAGPINSLTVSAIGTASGGDAGFTLAVVTAPGAPTMGTASAGNGEINVAFTAPTSTGGNAITGYTATCTSSDGGVSGSQSGPSSPLVVTSLTNGKTYTCTVTATNSVGTGAASAESNSVVPKSDQTITFDNPGTQNFSSTPTLTASSTSGLTVTFTSSTTDVCTITGGGVLTFVDTGVCTINANQAGNDVYEQATAVSQSFTVQDTFPGGTGTHDDPYQITSWNHLNDIRNDLAAHYQLAIDLTPQTRGYETHASDTANAGQGWLPIGTLSDVFAGSFDGGGYTISGLIINRPSLRYTGLFGFYRPPLDQPSFQIKDVGLRDINIVGGETTGGLVGKVGYTTGEYRIENAYVDIGSVSGTLYVGGLIGDLDNDKARKIYASVDVSGHDEVGGLIGRHTGVVEDCFALGAVSISDPNSIPSEPKGIGGLIGWSARTVQRCYATGAVDPAGAETLTGGLFGTTISSVVFSNSYWDVSTTSQTSGNGRVDEQANGLDSSGMRQLDQIATSWDFENVWAITDPATGLASYPYLRPMPMSPPPGLTGEPAAPTLTAPADDATGIDVVPTLTWSSALLANAYELVLETADGLTTVYQGSVDSTSFTPEMLQGNTMYRWRVRGVNSLLDPDAPDLGPYSAFFNFTTGPRPDEIFSDRFQATEQ